MSSKFNRNEKREKNLPLIVAGASLELPTDILTIRCKFNFHYFNKHCAGQDFKQWEYEELIKLLENLTLFSENSLTYWKNQNSRLVIYDNFPIPAKTDFKEPRNVPLEAKWGRFRLGGKIRLIGFVIPETYDNKEHETTGKRWDINTFYIVFLDENHRFWHDEDE